MYMDGCYSRTVELLREDAVYVGAVAIVLALVMVSSYLPFRFRLGCLTSL